MACLGLIKSSVRIFLPKMSYIPKTESFQKIDCKFIQLHYTSNINYIKASTSNIRQSFVKIYQNVHFFVCHATKIRNANTIELNPQLIMTIRTSY